MKDGSERCLTRAMKTNTHTKKKIQRMMSSINKRKNVENLDPLTTGKRRASDR